MIEMCLILIDHIDPLLHALPAYDQHHPATKRVLMWLKATASIGDDKEAARRHCCCGVCLLEAALSLVDRFSSWQSKSATNEKHSNFKVVFVVETKIDWFYWPNKV